jgi:hypothetical protein
MDIKLKDYIRLLPEFKKTLEIRNPSNKQDFLSEYASCMGIPLIILYKFMLILEGPSDYFSNKIKELCDFYSVKLKEDL